MFDPFQFNTTPAIIFGTGKAPAMMPHVADRLGPRVLLVTDTGLRKAGVTSACETALQAVADITVFDAVEADPSVETVARAATIARAAAVTGVLAVGGGSPMDVAKVVALALGSSQPLDEAWGVGQAKGPRLPLALVPTTAGTGSEVTPVAILTVAGAEKRGIVSPVLLPDCAVLDPQLTVGLPPLATAATGVDAMVHAIEAYTSRAANANPVSRALATSALKLLGAHIEQAVAEGADLAARSNMILGSMLAGQAFANAPVAAVHALAYPIGGHFHIPHGLSNALVLVPVMRFNAEACAAEYAALAPHVFPQISTANPQQTCTTFIAELGALSARLGLPPRLRDVDIPRDALPRMATAAMQQTRLLVNNPRPMTEQDALAIYDAAW